MPVGTCSNSIYVFFLGERVCFWEHCNERYSNQSTLVEHIERVHVNSYKGELVNKIKNDFPESR